MTVIRYDLIVCGDKDEMAAEAARERVQSMCRGVWAANLHSAHRSILFL